MGRAAFTQGCWDRRAAPSCVIAPFLHVNLHRHHDVSDPKFGKKIAVFITHEADWYAAQRPGHFDLWPGFSTMNCMIPAGNPGFGLLAPRHAG